MEFYEILKFSFLISLVNLDERNLGSFTISRPIISGVIFGLIFNNIFLGLYVGTIIEMFIVNLLPVGNFIAPSGAVITGIIIYISNYFYMHEIEYIFPIILLYGLSVGHISKRVSRMLWVFDNSLVEKFINKVKNGKIHFATFNWISLIVSVFAFMLLCFISIFFGIFIINYISEFIVNNFVTKNILKFIFKYLPIFSLVYFLNIYDVPYKLWFIALGFLSAAILNLFILNSEIVFIITVVLFITIIFAWNVITAKLKI